MSGKRVLFLGLTGIDKRSALNRLAKWCETNYSRTCHVLDFEKDCLFSNYPQSSFLDGTPRQQRTSWDAAWNDLWSSELGAMVEGNDDVFLSMHGSYIRGHYGSRCILDVHQVTQFNPHLIVTLIADVYDMWWRTEKRAQGEPWRGRPTLEQLVLGRRTEVLIGDQIALSSKTKPKNLVLAAGHPCDTIAHCIYHESPRVVYLSFPISAPRRMAEAGNPKGIEDVSNFVLKAYQRQKASPQLAFVCPLGIDEIPFVRILGGIEKDQEQVVFNREQLRWNLGDFWPAEDRLSDPAQPYNAFDVEQINVANGNIYTDVTWRDYRLVEQADRLAVFNPVFDDSGKLSRGVKNEIDFATPHGLPVYIFQDKSHDSKGAFDNWLDAQSGGTMGTHPGATRIIRKDTSTPSLMPLLVSAP